MYILNPKTAKRHQNWQMNNKNIIEKRAVLRRSVGSKTTKHCVRLNTFQLFSCFSF